MKTTNKILATLLAVLTLAGSLSFSLQKMECLSSGNTLYALTSFDCCSSEDREIEAVRSKCCNLENYNLEGKNFLNTKVKSDKDQTKPISISLNSDEIGNLKFHSRNFKSNFNIPPPWVETDYQVLFQSFLC